MDAAPDVYAKQDIFIRLKHGRESGLAAGNVKEYFEPGHSHLSLCLKRFIFCPSFFVLPCCTFHHTQSHAHLKFFKEDCFEQHMSSHTIAHPPEVLHHTQSQMPT